MKATAKDLRFHSKKLLDTVSRGEEVIITYRGKSCAKLVPFNEGKNKGVSEDKLFGIWKDNEAVEDVDNYVSKLRKSRW